MHDYLPELFLEVVVPMSRHFRQLMLMFKLQTEASIFASDLRYKISDDSQAYKNVEGYKPDESLIVLNH